MTHFHAKYCFGAFVILLALFFINGCSVIPGYDTTADPGSQLNNTGKKPSSEQLDSLALQSLVMSMADEYVSSISEVAFLSLRPKAENSQERVLIQSFLRNSFGAAAEIAASRNPDVALLDLLVLVTLQRQTFENYWIPKIWGEARGQEALVRIKAIEDSLWKRSSVILTDEQHVTLRTLIDAWLEANPDRLVIELIRFDEFADARWMTQQHHRDAAKGLLQEIDSAVGAIDEALLFGERAMWYSGRLAYIAGEQAELSAYRILAAPEIQSALSQFGEFQQTLDRIQATLASYPDAIAEREEKLFQNLRLERERAIDHLFERIAQERAEIFGSFSESTVEVEQMLPATLELLNAAAELAASTNDAALSLDQLLARFDQEASVARPGTETPADSGLMTTIQLLQTSSELAAQLQQLSPQLSRDIAAIEKLSNEVVDRLFWRLAALIGLIFAGLIILKRLPARH